MLKLPAMSNAETFQLRTITDRWLSKSGSLFMPVWLTLVVASIAWGWSSRDQYYLTAENGLGYWLGIIGGSMMLMLLSYSLRKRMRVLKRFLSIKLWFQFHMTLGILGPLLILFHSNFQLGSLNSTVALVCMLLVAGSGLIGRYLYGKIHFGLYGEKIKLQQVRKDFQVLKSDILTLVPLELQPREVEGLFEKIESLIESHTGDVNVSSTSGSRKQFKKISASLESYMKRMESYYREHADNQQSFEAVYSQLSNYSSVLVAALRKLPGLQRSEKLFSLWHVIHIPVFGLMIITAITHVVAVHMY